MNCSFKTNNLDQINSLMYQIFISLISVSIMICGCTFKSDTQSEPGNIEEKHLTNSERPVCPQNHTDSIIPVIWGFPSEESFEKADSGLVYLGGCELPENAPNWFCKIHQVTF